MKKLEIRNLAWQAAAANFLHDMKKLQVLVPGTDDLHVPFDVGVGSKPCFISDQNAGTSATNKHPQAMHVSELLEQTKDSRDVVRIRRSQVVVSLANQFFTLIPNKVAETVRNFDVPPVTVYHRNVLRVHFKLQGGP